MLIRLIVCLKLVVATTFCYSQSITLVDNQTAATLANTLSGKGITVLGTGMTLNCNSLANGLFANVNPTPNLSLAIDSGVILTTGRVLSTATDTAIDKDWGGVASTNWGITTTDAQITSLAGTAAVQRDLCFLQFNFIPEGDSAYIDYAFASEEYPEYACLRYIDVFGIFVSPLSGSFSNYAKVPGTTRNVSINSINDTTTKWTGAANYDTFCTGLGTWAPYMQYYTPNLISNHIVFDGFTKPLRARIPVIPNQTHTMKIVIADIVDGTFDSGIFLDKSSFTSPPLIEITERRATNGSTKDSLFLIEGCNSGTVKFERSTISTAMTVNASFSGTASGADFSASSSFTIPAGTSTYFYNVSALTDALSESVESLKIVFTVSSINYSDSAQFYIKDFANGIDIFNGIRDTALCVGRSVGLTHTNSDTTFKTVWTPATNLSCTNCLNATYTANTPNVASTQYVFLRISSLGCATVDSPIAIQVHPNPSVSLTPSHSICIGDSVQLNPTVTPTGVSFSYQWTPTTGLSSSTIRNPIAKPNSTQTYKLLVVNPNGGCADSSNTVVSISTIRNEIDSMVATGTTCGTSNGSIRLYTKTTAPNNPPYSYSINGGSTFVSTNVFNGLAAGTYNIAIRNGSGCRFDTSLTIQAGTNPPSATYTVTNTSCGLVNGSAVVNSTSGTAPLTIAWKQGASVISNASSITSRPFGSYTLCVTDSAGCLVQYSFNIQGSSAPNFNLFKTDQTCGLSNGSISASATGGQFPYTYAWSNGGTTNTISNLSAGKYILTLTDVNSCVKVDSTTIVAFPPISHSKSGVNASCGMSNGSVTAIVSSGGTAPFIYVWSNGVTTSPSSNTTNTISNLSGGRYKFTIQDSKGCQAFDSVDISSSPAVNISISRVNATCGNNNGSINVNMLSGTPAYTFLWNDGLTSQNRTGLAPGSYSVTVTDINGCTNNGAAVVTMNSSPVLTTTKVNTTCANNNGRISANVSGASPPVTYAWSNASSSNFIDNLMSGIYGLTITDALGCQKISSDTILASIDVNFTDSIIHPKCNGSNGEIYLKNFVGTSPFSVTWSDGNTSTTRLSMAPGIYNMFVQDSFGCQKSKTYTLNTSSTPSVSLAVTQAFCAATTGSINSSVVGGIPAYTYVWSSGETTPHITGKNPGVYSLTVTDFNNCTGTATDSILRRPSPTFSDSFRKATCGIDNGRIYVYDIVGSGPYNFVWSHDAGINSATVFGLPSANISMTVTDDNGCTASDTWDLTTNGEILATTFATKSLCRDSTGTLTVNITNGTPPYSIQWSNGDTGVMADSLQHATYGLLITDSFGCQYRDSIDVIDSTTLKDTFVMVKTRCDTASGTILAMPFGGTPPYSHVWNRLPRDTFALLDSVSVGVYEIRTIDSNGCKYDTSAEMRYTHYPEIIDSIILESCTGGNGEVHITIDSVIEPIQIFWNAALDSTYNKLSLTGPIGFNIRVVDSHQCEVSLGVFIDTNPIPQPTLTTIMPPCGNNLGSISVQLTDPVVAQSYAWSHGPASSTVNNLAPGIYTVTITDTAGCVYILSDTLAYTTAPTINYELTRPNCGGTDGEIKANVISSYGDYNYRWRKLPAGSFTTEASASTSAIMSNLDSGQYVVSIRDSVGCIILDTMSLIDSAAPQIQVQIKNSHCTNGNGSVKVVPLTGVAPYSYLWYNFSTLDSVTNLFDGSYTVTVTDARNCVTIDTADILNVPTPELSLLGVNSLCGPNNGGVITSVSFGQSPFTFNWSNGDTSQNLTGLAAGTYILTITDSAGCIGIDSVSIISQPPLQVSIARSLASCDLNNGAAVATILSGQAPYIYHWNSTIPSLSISGLDTGQFYFYISDSNNCEHRDTINIQRVKKHSASHTVINDNCTYSQGSITTTVIDGKPPMNYSWSGGLGNNQNAINVGAGTYTLSITDSLGCLVTSLVNVGDTSGPIVSLNVVEATCGSSNGSINANVVSSRIPLNYFWNNAPSASTSITGINGGKYVFRVIDSRGCIKEDSVTLDTVKVLTGMTSFKNPNCNLNNGYIKVSATGGSGTKSYTWSHIATNTDSVFGLSPGTYTVTVNDTKGCQWIDTIVLVQKGLPNIAFLNTPATCRGPNGAIQSIVTNATGIVTYLWSTGANTAGINGVIPNTYVLTVTDQTGCSATSSSILTSIGVDSIYLSVSNPKCNVNNGTIKANAFNTAGSVNYLWTNGSTADSISLLSPNVYTVTVTDSLCMFTRTANLVMFTSPVVSVTKQDASCGINNGTLTTSVSQGTSPFTFNWNGSISPPSISSLDSGTYKLVVTDIQGCKDSTTIVLNRIPMLTASLAVLNSKCGDPNGAITTTVSGGKPGFQFAWSNGATTQSLTNISDGTYTLTLSDNGNCTITESRTVIDRKKPNVLVSIKDFPLCGKPNGKLTSNVFDGNPQFKYLWNTGDTTPELSNINTGLFILTVTDNLGCTDADTISLNPGVPPAFNIKNIYRSTCQLPNGSIRVNIPRLINPVYTWSTGFIGDSISGIGPGKYVVVVTDDRQCEIIDTFEMPSTKTPKIVLSQTESFCLKNNGTVSSSVSEATPPYRYLWSTGSVKDNISNLFPGEYKVTVTDTLNCIDSARITVTEEENKVKATYDTFNLRCYRDSSGRVKFYPSGGQAPYTFRVDTPTLNSTTYGLKAGRNYFTVTDNRGCEYYDSFMLSEPPRMVTSLIYKKDLICNNQPDGEIHVKTTGGVFPYSYVWSPSGIVGDRALGLYSGEHVVQLTDLQGCQDTFMVILSQPNAIVLSALKVANPCNGQSKASINVSVNNGTYPYVFNWSNGSRDNMNAGLEAGYYYLTVTDSNGCKVIHKDSIVDPPMLESGQIVSKEDLKCENLVDGKFEIVGTGGLAPYSYSIDSGKTYALQNKFVDLDSGNYFVIIRDDERCRTFKNVRIEGYPEFNLSAYPEDGTVNLGESVPLWFEVNSGDRNWINKIEWRESEGLSCVDCESPIASIYHNTSYVIEVEYSEKCKAYDTIHLRVIDENDLYIPNAFSPNAKNVQNHEFKVYANNVLRAELTIYNRWGEKVFETDEGHTLGWKGFYKGEPALAGKYSYHAKVIFLSNRREVRRGTFILLR